MGSYQLLLNLSLSFIQHEMCKKSKERSLKTRGINDLRGFVVELIACAKESPLGACPNTIGSWALPLTNYTPSSVIWLRLALGLVSPLVDGCFSGIPPC
jgi:hypothetical protein